MGRIDGAFSAEDLATLPRGHLALRAAPATGRVDAEADYIFADPEVRLTNLRLRSLGATADGTLAVPTDGAPVRGSVRIAADSLAPWLALAGLDGDGGAAGDLRLSGDGSRQGADLTGTLTNVSWRSGGEPVLRAARAAVTVRATDPLGRPAGRAEVEATAVTAGELRLDTLSLGAEGDGSDAALRLKATGAFRGPLALDAAGRLRIGENRLSLEILTATGHAFGQSLTLRAPATLTQQPGTVALSRLDLDFGAARIGAQADVDADRVAGELTVAGLPVASLSPLWPVAGMTGTIGATVTLDGPRANPTGNAHLTGTGLMIDAAGDAPPLGLDVSGTWLNRRLILTGRLTGTPERDAELDAEVPLVLDADRLAFSVPGGEPVSARVSWRGDMASLWPLLPLDAHRMTGAAEIAAELAGNLAAPEVSGSLRLTGGEYESFEAGTLIEDIDLALDVADNRAVLSRLTGTDGAKGQLTATGELAIAPEQGYPFKLNAGLSAFALVRRDDVTAVADGRLSFAGTPEQSTLAGQFTTRSVEARIIDRLPAEVASLDVVETDTSEKAAAFRENTKKNGGGPNIALDVAVAMPRQVFVRGRGLESEWAGDLKVTGTAREPIIKGELTVVRGYLSVLTKTFRLTGGSVRFPGGRDAAPELDVRAEHKARNLTVTAQVSGPATNPSIALSSSPALPQDEIVSRVLFDRSTAQLGALEAAQLAAAVSELTGAGGGLGPLDFARSLLGVDVLRIETAEPGTAGGPEVEAGKYVSDDVYVGVKKGVADDAGAVGVEIELTPNISVESETGTTGESDLGIKFKWDY